MAPALRIFPAFAVVSLLVMLSSSAAWADIRVNDDAGQELVLERPARRIVSLAPHITELLFAAGAGDFVVGVSAFSDYPAAARAIPRIGGGSGLDVEAIVALQPDLVVAWQSGNPARQITHLQSLGMTVFVSEPQDLMAVPDTMEKLGRLAGTETVARDAVAAYTHRYKQLKQQYSDRADVNVFYQIWAQPVMTVNGRHLISAVMRLCGGRNVFADLASLAPRVDVEAVLAANPEVIIAGDDSGSDLRPLAQWRRWPEIAAVQHDHLYTIPRELLVRHSPRILEGAELLCRMLDKVRAE
ncbi:MAG: cobalamin-binding protein [Gammaproteobacteria bacterium]